MERVVEETKKVPLTKNHAKSPLQRFAVQFTKGWRVEAEKRFPSSAKKEKVQKVK